MRAPLAAIVLSAAACWLLMVPALACTGGPLSADGHSYEEAAEVIFTGTAVRVEDPSTGLSGSSADPMAWTFVVDNVEKGEVGIRFTVTTPRFDASCGYGFKLGHRYRVLAWHYEEAPNDLRVTLGNGTEPRPTLPDAPPIEGAFTHPSGGIGGLVLLVAILPGLGGIVYASVVPRAGRGRRMAAGS